MEEMKGCSESRSFKTETADLVEQADGQTEKTCDKIGSIKIKVSFRMQPEILELIRLQKAACCNQDGQIKKEDYACLLNHTQPRGASAAGTLLARGGVQIAGFKQKRSEAVQIPAYQTKIQKPGHDRWRGRRADRDAPGNIFKQNARPLTVDRARAATPG